MDALTIAILSGVGGLFLWIIKFVIEKIFKKFFADAEALDELKNTMLQEKITWLNKAVEDLKTSIKQNAEENIRYKITMQSLSKEISGLRSEIKLGDNKYQKGIEQMARILQSMNQTIKKHGDEIESFGKIIIRMPGGE